MVHTSTRKHGPTQTQVSGGGTRSQSHRQIAKGRTKTKAKAPTPKKARVATRTTGARRGRTSTKQVKAGQEKPKTEQELKSIIAPKKPRTKPQSKKAVQKAAHAKAPRFEKPKVRGASEESIKKYDSTDELPPNVQKYLPEHAQHIYMKAFNAAEDRYQDPKKRRNKNMPTEKVAHAVAWKAVRNKYDKGADQKWHGPEHA